MDVRGRRRSALWVGGVGAVTMVAAVIVFVLRPSGAATLPTPFAGPIRPTVPNAPLGKLVCVFQPERSRVTISPTTDIALDWGRSGCADGGTQYQPTGDRWERVQVSDGEQTVAVQSFDPATRRYTSTRYLLGAQAMAQMRALRAAGDGAAARCTVDPVAIERLAQQQAAIRAALPPLPNEKLVYACHPG